MRSPSFPALTFARTPFAAINALIMRTKIKAQLKGVGIVLVIMGLVFAGLGLRAQNRQAELAAHGVTAPAEITEAAIERGAKSSKRCIVTVQWGEPQSRQTRKFEVEKEHYLKLVDSEGKLVAPNTTIRHLPGQPDTALLEGATYPMIGFASAGYGFMIVGALLIFLGFRISAEPAP